MMDLQQLGLMNIRLKRKQRLEIILAAMCLDLTITIGTQEIIIVEQYTA